MRDNRWISPVARTEVSKYGIPHLEQNDAHELGVLTECVRVTSITLSWKVVWFGLIRERPHRTWTSEASTNHH